ncbi:superinfection immunity protein [Lentibacillus sp. JNUCC-1]|uniref:superinfection immunity protein n=1 Tax=Lentibacillus sp. JNUCC-1 TaxID=2654513 RepID=UPI003FA5C778
MYFTPAIIGFVRKKDNALAIFLLNLFLGWSLIAWVISLVWATSKDASPQQVVIQNHNSPAPNQPVEEKQ